MEHTVIQDDCGKERRKKLTVFGDPMSRHHLDYSQNIFHVRKEYLLRHLCGLMLRWEFS